VTVDFVPGKAELVFLKEDSGVMLPEPQNSSSVQLELAGLKKTNCPMIRVNLR
jgi:hypothetical protein